MISFKGPGIKIFAAILAVIALGAGIYFTFFQAKGYEKAEATIVSVENDPDYIPDPDSKDDVRRIVTVKYTADGKEYTAQLDSDSTCFGYIITGILQGLFPYVTGNNLICNTRFNQRNRQMTVVSADISNPDTFRYQGLDSI